MRKQQETKSNSQVDQFAEALAAARKMQQDWLTYGIDFVHIYVEDVDGDWLEKWGNDDIVGNCQLDHIKEFLVSNDEVAVRVRQLLGTSSLFDFALNLEELWRIPEAHHRLSAVRDLLVNEGNNLDMGLADSLVVKLDEILV